MPPERRETAKLSDFARATATGLCLRQGIGFDDWVCAGRQIARMSSASCWWLGDWLNYGERAWGHRYRRALQETPYDYQTLRNYAWVAHRIELSRRRDDLTFQHHAEVASLPSAERDLWLERAHSFGWSRNELRRRLAASGRRRAARGRSLAVVTVQVTTDRERRWRNAASAAEQELADWIMRVADDAADAVLEEPVPQLTEGGLPADPVATQHAPVT